MSARSAQVDDVVAGGVLAAVRLEPVEEHGEVVASAELGRHQGAVHVSEPGGEAGQRPGFRRARLLVAGCGSSRSPAWMRRKARPSLLIVMNRGSGTKGFCTNWAASSPTPTWLARAHWRLK
jgi:hypothetical protein